MSDFVTLTCPSCGGRLEITKDVERFACAHCGNEHVVRRAGALGLFALGAYANQGPAGSTASSGIILIVAGLVLGGLALMRRNEGAALHSYLKTAQTKLAPAQEEYETLKQDLDAQYRIVNTR